MKKIMFEIRMELFWLYFKEKYWDLIRELSKE